MALADVIDTALVPTTIAQTLGMRESGDVPLEDLLKEYLRPQGAAAGAGQLRAGGSGRAARRRAARAAAAAEVLVTSRAPLHLHGEHELRRAAAGRARHRTGCRPSSSSPSTRRCGCSSSARRRSKPDFALTDENAPAVAEICVRLDGLPLAIELAAARVKMLHAAGAAGPARQPPRAPHRRGRDLPARQQTLRGAIAWSYDLLERRRAARCSPAPGVFVGRAARWRPPRPSATRTATCPWTSSTASPRF